ncbi:uncharacterized protein N7479_008004 [Penicillium vulpinum]|uniref:uncharacterized protein n=1 Tax=Penicillium vulpinum TaxID=29845 RepID=UPI002549009D|nr:uncharacterized protein N7479_008004 [Penicillium vulpinum]KAJ5960854.1 hypothetical protein N7479_008004 [Penicillium vulpinum]
MADAPTDIRYDRVWFYEMDDLSNDAEYTSGSSYSNSIPANSSFHPPPLPKPKSVAVAKQPRNSGRHYGECWASWKQLPTALNDENVMRRYVYE